MQNHTLMRSRVVKCRDFIHAFSCNCGEISQNSITLQRILEKDRSLTTYLRQLHEILLQDQSFKTQDPVIFQLKTVMIFDVNLLPDGSCHHNRGHHAGQGTILLKSPSLNRTRIPPGKYIIFSTKSIICSTRSIMFSTESISFSTKFIIFSTRSIIFSTRSIMFSTHSHLLAGVC